MFIKIMIWKYILWSVLCHQTLKIKHAKLKHIKDKDSSANRDSPDIWSVYREAHQEKYQLERTHFWKDADPIFCDVYVHSIGPNTVILILDWNYKVINNLSQTLYRGKPLPWKRFWPDSSVYCCSRSLPKVSHLLSNTRTRGWKFG